MTLEWLRRNDAKWDEVLRTYLFTEAPIIEVEHEAETEFGSRQRFALHRRPAKGTAPMNHLIRELAPVPSTAWEQIDEEAAPYPAPLPHRAPARRRQRPARLGRGVGDARSRRGRRGRAGWYPGPASATCSHCSSTAPSSGSNGPSSTRSTAARSTPTSTPSATPPAGSRSPRTPRCSTATRTARIEGIAPSSPHEKIPISDEYRDYPGIGRARRSRCCRPSGIAGPYAVALGPRCYTGVIETTEMGGYPGPRAPPPHRRRPGALGAGSRRRGRPLDPRRRLRADARRRTSRSATSITTRRRCTSTSRSRSPSPC